MLDSQLSNGAWTYPYNANEGNFRAYRAASTFTNSSDAPLYDVKLTLPYLYLVSGTRYRPAHWVDDRGIFLTGPSTDASPDGSAGGMDPTDPGFTAYILDAAERPEGTLTPWTRERVGDIPVTSLSASYYNASFPTSLSPDDSIPTWNLGDIAPGDTVSFVFELRFERRAGGAALGWQMPEVHAAANWGCAPSLSLPATSTAVLPTTEPVPVAQDVNVGDYDTSDFNGGSLTLDTSSLPAGEAIQFGATDPRVVVDGATLLLDGSPIGSIAEADGIVIVVFTSSTTVSQLETLVRSLGLVGAETAGVRTATLRIVDPQSNASNEITLIATLTDGDEETVDDGTISTPLSPEPGTPSAPDTGVPPSNSVSLWPALLASVTIVLALVIRHARPSQLGKRSE